MELSDRGRNIQPSNLFCLFSLSFFPFTHCTYVYISMYMQYTEQYRIHRIHIYEGERLEYYCIFSSPIFKYIYKICNYKLCRHYLEYQFMMVCYCTIPYLSRQRWITSQMLPLSCAVLERNIDVNLHLWQQVHTGKFHITTTISLLLSSVASKEKHLAKITLFKCHH